MSEEEEAKPRESAEVCVCARALYHTHTTRTERRAAHKSSPPLFRSLYYPLVSPSVSLPLSRYALALTPFPFCRWSFDYSITLLRALGKDD